MTVFATAKAQCASAMPGGRAVGFEKVLVTDVSA